MVWCCFDGLMRYLMVGNFGLSKLLVDLKIDVFGGVVRFFVLFLSLVLFVILDVDEEVIDREVELFLILRV